jgi:hypothetical protein
VKRKARQEASLELPFKPPPAEPPMDDYALLLSTYRCRTCVAKCRYIGSAEGGCTLYVPFKG